MNEEWLADMFANLLNTARGKEQLTDAHYTAFKHRELNTLDELETAYSELIHFLQNHDYYDTIERIEKGEALLQKERNHEKRRKYQARLNELYAKLERLKPEEGAA